MRALTCLKGGNGRHTATFKPWAAHPGSRSLIQGVLKWLRQTQDRAPWLMALEPGALPPSSLVDDQARTGA